MSVSLQLLKYQELTIVLSPVNILLVIQGWITECPQLCDHNLNVILSPLDLFITPIILRQMYSLFSPSKSQGFSCSHIYYSQFTRTLTHVKINSSENVFLARRL